MFAPRIWIISVDCELSSKQIEHAAVWQRLARLRVPCLKETRMVNKFYNNWLYYGIWHKYDTFIDGIRHKQLSGINWPQHDSRNFQRRLKINPFHPIKLDWRRDVQWMSSSKKFPCHKNGSWDFPKAWDWAKNESNSIQYRNPLKDIFVVLLIFQAGKFLY